MFSRNLNIPLDSSLSLKLKGPNSLRRRLQALLSLDGWAKLDWSAAAATFCRLSRLRLVATSRDLAC